MHNNLYVVAEGILDPKDKLYKFYGFPRKDPRPFALIANIGEQSIIWH
jgi:hypothetical protein